MILIKTQDQFNEYIKHNNVLVFFYAEWNNPCKMMIPIIDKLSNERNDYEFISVDMDRLMRIGRDYRINQVPAYRIISNGEVKKEFSGLMSEEEFIKILDE